MHKRVGRSLSGSSFFGEQPIDSSLTVNSRRNTGGFGKAPLAVATEQLVQEIDGLFDKVSDVEEGLILAEACMTHLKREDPNAVRGCLVKSALARHIEKWATDETVTVAQESRWADLKNKIGVLDDLSVDLVGQLPEKDRAAVLGVAAKQAARDTSREERLTQLIDLCERMQKAQHPDGLSMARSLLHGLGAAFDGLGNVPAVRRMEGRLQAVLLEQVKRSCGSADLRSAAQFVGRARTRPGAQGVQAGE